VRSWGMNALRGRGFDADSFGAAAAQARAHREAVAGALTATEGWLEYEHPRWEEREALREVRRRLECELWP